MKLLVKFAYYFLMIRRNQRLNMRIIPETIKDSNITLNNDIKDNNDFDIDNFFIYIDEYNF